MSEPHTDDRADVPAEAWSGVHRGPLREGEWVRLVDQKGRKHNLELVAGKRFFSNKGHLDHDDMIRKRAELKSKVGIVIVTPSEAVAMARNS